MTEFLVFWSVGRYGDAVLQIFAQGINTACYPWICKLILSLLRERGSLASQAEHYTNRALKVVGLQTLIGVSAAAMGFDGRETFGRAMAAASFTIILVFGWFYLVAIFDVAGLSSRAAAKLRTTCLQTAALISTGLHILSGLAGYILATSKNPSRRAAMLVIYAMMLTYYISLAFVFRLVWKARYYGSGAAAPAAAASVKPVDALGALDLP